MKRLAAVLVVVSISLFLGPAPVGGQHVDPLHIGRIGSPGGLEGGYSTNPGQFQFLILASPLTCNDGSDPALCPHPVRVYFYNTSCTRVDSLQVALGKNQVAVLPLHDPAITANRVGNFLVAAADPAAPDQALLTGRSVAGISYFFDLNAGVARAEELARVSNGPVADRNGTGWSSYNAAAAALLAPPDDGVSFINTLQLRCPVGVSVSGPGVIGTPNTLGGDMLDLGAQNRGQDPGDDPGESFLFPVEERALIEDRDDAFNGTFAAAVTATIYDLDGNVLGTVASFPCSCLTETRLGTISPLATSQFTYWELFSTGGTPGTEIFTGALNILAPAAGPTINFFHRLHHARRTTNITP